MWNDKESSVDYLHFEEIAFVAKNILEDESLRSTSIGIFGSWGSGKSTVLELIKNELNQKDEVIIICFDAWLYQNYSDAKTSLLETIQRTLEKEVSKVESIAEDVKKLGKSIFKLKNLLPLLSIAFGTATSIATGGVLPPISPALGSIETIIDNLEEQSSDSEIVEDIRKSFSEILNKLKKNVIVIVDNLDRCLPQKALETLEAIRLFLFLPNTSFVIAADVDMIKESLESVFHADSKHRNDYLDKLIQFPIPVPKLGLAEIRSYLFMLFAESHKLPSEQRERLREKLKVTVAAYEVGELSPLKDILDCLDAEQQEKVRPTFQMCDSISVLLSKFPTVASNPRTIKRLLNSFEMRKLISKNQSINLEDEVIMKLVLLEKIVSSQQMVNFYHLMKTDYSAFEKDLKILEQGKESQISPEQTKAIENLFGRGKLEEVSDLIVEWAGVPPHLSASPNIKLSAYLYRKAMALQVQYQRLSDTSLEAIRILSNTNVMYSANAKEIISRIPTNEIDSVMDEVIKNINNSPSWTKMNDVNGLCGAILLAENQPTVKEKLIDFFTHIDKTKNNVWIKTLIKRLRGK